MNTINFEVIIEEEKEFPENNKETWNIGIEGKLDNEKIYKYKEFPINILELIKSKDMSGGFYIFTCSCGIPECGGVDPIIVKHRNGNTFWTFKKSNIEFEQKEYQIKIDLLIQSFLDSYEFLKTGEVEVSVYPGIFLELNSEEDIISKIKNIKRFEEEEKIKYDLCRFVYDNYELKEFVIWLEKTQKIADIIGNKIFNEIKNKSFDSIKEVKKYIKTNLSQPIINELKELNKYK